MGHVMEQEKQERNPTKIDDVKLKDCPFCGFHFELDHLDEVIYPSGRGPDVQIVCPEIYGGCNAEIVGSSIEDVVWKWNHRPEDGRTPRQRSPYYAAPTHTIKRIKAQDATLSLKDDPVS